MAPNISFTRRCWIIGYHKSGYSIPRIVSLVKCSEKTVRYWIRVWNEVGEDAWETSRRSTRYKRRTTPEQDADLVQEITENPFLPVVNAVANLDLPISQWTARRRLREAGLRCHRPTRKVALSLKHREARVGFALEELTTSLEDWDRTIFVDQRVFFSSTEKEPVAWTPMDHKLYPQYVIPRVDDGQIICAMWGWISTHCPGELVEVPPHMDASEYVNILENIFLPSIRSLYNEGDMPSFRLVLDNCTVPTSYNVKSWFKNHPEIRVLDWPGCSPDLNPMEDIWAEIVKRWTPDGERTRDALMQHAQNVWEELRMDSKYFAALRNSIPDRLSRVIDRGGLWSDH